MYLRSIRTLEDISLAIVRDINTRYSEITRRRVTGWNLRIPSRSLRLPLAHNHIASQRRGTFTVIVSSGVVIETDVTLNECGSGISTSDQFDHQMPICSRDVLEIKGSKPATFRDLFLKESYRSRRRDLRVGNERHL